MCSIENYFDSFVTFFQAKFIYLIMTLRIYFTEAEKLHIAGTRTFTESCARKRMNTVHRFCHAKFYDYRQNKFRFRLWQKNHIFIGDIQQTLFSVLTESKPFCRHMWGPIIYVRIGRWSERMLMIRNRNYQFIHAFQVNSTLTHDFQLFFGEKSIFLSLEKWWIYAPLA